MTEWIEAQFPSGTRTGVTTRSGFVNGAGLGIFLEREAEGPDVEPPPLGDIWCLIHLNTGHAIARIEGLRPSAFALGDELAAIGDWTFIGVNDWQEAQPDLQDKVHTVVRAFAARGSFMGAKASDETIANAVYVARAHGLQKAEG